MKKREGEGERQRKIERWEGVWSEGERTGEKSTLYIHMEVATTYTYKYGGHTPIQWNNIKSLYM